MIDQNTVGFVAEHKKEGLKKVLAVLIAPSYDPLFRSVKVFSGRHIENVAIVAAKGSHISKRFFENVEKRKQVQFIRGDWAAAALLKKRFRGAGPLIESCKVSLDHLGVRKQLSSRAVEIRCGRELKYTAEMRR